MIAQIHIEGGPTLRCESGSNLLRAALCEGLGFPYECNSGGCGNCQFELLEGEMTDLWEAAPGLPPRARAAGRRLGCQTQVVGDCRIRVRLKPEFVAVKAAALRTARLIERKALTHDMAEYSFMREGAADFLPGQYAMLRLPGVTGDRAYSMSNLPNPEGRWSFIVKRTPNGHGSAVLAEGLREGDQVGLDGPYGLAYLRPEAPRDLICIGGGSGLSPLKSIITAAVRHPALATRRIHLFYGGRTPADICTDQILDEDVALRERVEVVPAISDGLPSNAPWAGERGFIHEVLQRWLGAARDAREYEYYFCGPPPMTDAVQRLLMLERRVPATQLHFDRFL
ncbi:FAD-binding oxidoreductase [Polycyclovorans algicola]|uniref:FAD-binding oxidoreductase n=1 Tax=Polycyclovorans algicola TaxID=616992 RepID=UPI0004A76A14|nr:FAD-binding oxidoreductase [Polycyclovorans algicola]